jgi:heme o synthase
MLLLTHGVALTKLQVLLYSLLLPWASLLRYLVGMSGRLYLGGTLVLGLGFVYHALRLWRSPDDSHATRTFWYSILYLTALFGLLLADHYSG